MDINYKQIVDNLNHELLQLHPNNCPHWFYFELQQYRNMEGDITLIYLIDSGNDNKYRVYHSELDDWIVNGKELEEDIHRQLNEYVSDLVRVITMIGIVNNVNKEVEL